MATEAVAGAFLSTAIEALFDWVNSPKVQDFFGNKNHTNALLRKLETTLGSAQGLLNDAEDKQIKDSMIKRWVDDLNEVILDADDVTDEINTEFLRLENEDSTLESSGKRVIKRKFNDIMNLFPNNTTIGKIENVISRLNSLLEQKDYLGLKGGVRSKRLDRSPVPLIGDPCDVCGRQDDKEEIVKKVLSENVEGVNGKISVIPIVGMGGIGKTTLARIVYNDTIVKKHFEDKRAWVTVSDDFDIPRLEKLVFMELTSEEPKTEDSGKLKEELNKKLGGKKFLLVLDDVWNDNYNKWNALRSFLEIEACGIKVIMTTRNKNIATMMGDVQYHHLQTLSDEDCWELFKKHCLFMTKNPIDVLEKLGRDIVKKCKGLPLAVISVAGLLRSTSNPKFWKQVLESEIWKLQEKGNYDILPSLWLSYSYLPSHLKRCFAYCSIFPKDYLYKEKKVILLWMAEGLIEEENKEQAGEEYIEELVSRSLFLTSTREESTFFMHDLVHDLATFAFGKGFSLKLDEINGVNKITSKTRHLICEMDLPDSKNKTQLSKAKCLRTLFLVENRYGNRYDLGVEELLQRFEYLRVLCLFKSTIEKVPNSIENLKQLRYLDLSHTKIQELPNTICSLYNLQTLLLLGCFWLAELPRNIDRLVKLRHLNITGTNSLKKMPHGICNLKSLRSLTKFVLSGEQSTCRLNELQELQNLGGKLEIQRLENVVSVEDVRKAEFHKKVITDLSLSWSGQTNDQQKASEVLDGLQPHHSNLNIFSIEGYGGKKFSSWVEDLSPFSNITRVTLSNCKHCCNLPPLGHLPSLNQLFIEECDSIEMISSEFYGFSNIKKINYIPFKSLESLRFYNMKAWKSWSLNTDGEIEARAFPCLKLLYLIDCQKLNSPLPHHFPSLEKLDIINCREMKALLPSGQMMNVAFPSLKIVIIHAAQTLEFAGILPFPSNLIELLFRNCIKLLEQRKQWGLQVVEKLEFDGCEDSFPEEGVVPSTVKNLTLMNSPNLKGFNGKVFQQLTSLRRLELVQCPELRCFPQEGLPASLVELRIRQCPKIIEQLKIETGQEWDKISHIPDLDVDWNQISSPAKIAKYEDIRTWL